MDSLLQAAQNCDMVLICECCICGKHFILTSDKKCPECDSDEYCISTDHVAITCQDCKRILIRRKPVHNLITGCEHCGSTVVWEQSK